jgi:putative DNA primase/helicase
MDDGIPAGVKVYAGGEAAREVDRVAAEAGVGELPIPCTDLGNAERLARRHGRDLHWCEDWKTWLTWTGTHWQKDNTQAVTALAKDTVRAVADEVRAEPDDERRRRLLKHALGSESAGRVEAMKQLCRAEPGIAITPNALDQDGWILPCANGTLDLRTGDLRPSLRDDLSTRSVEVPWDPTAECPLFLRFLDRVQPDPEVRAFLQRWAGYASTGVIREHVFVIHHGTGRNGKGVFVNAIMHVLGSFARQVPTDLLVETHGSKHPVDKMTLRGVRFASASETEAGARLATTVVKALTGGDTMSARGMGENFTEWKPTHKVALQTNPKPVIRESGPAIRDRLLLVPWAVYMPEHERDLDLGDKLKAEAPGILRWLVEGCLAWKRDGLAPPPAVRLATSEYLDDQDLVGQFLAERTTVQPAYYGAVVRENATSLYQAFSKWCESQGGRKPESQTAFGGALEERGFTKLKAGTVWRLGLRLLTDDEMAAAERAAASPEEEFQ